MTRTFYVTTPIYYVNDRPHIGHIYTTVVADVIARYRRLMGDEVRFVTGTDEHGQKMERSAAKSGVPEIALADAVVRNYQDLYPRFEITNDDFIRTTQSRHRLAVERIFRRMQARGDIYLGTYEGWYCTGCEAFYPDNQIHNGRCEVGHPVERMKEQSYFFRLSAYGEKLLELYKRREQQGSPFVRPRSRMNEVRTFVEGGLNDLSVSRNTVRWGIPVPDDPAHVVYVWVDALTNYLSALGYGSDHPSALFERFWRESAEATVLHIVGKDILRFHAVYWPAFLMSAGLPLPTLVYGHGWWLMDDAKMSKSFGNVVRPGPIVEAFGPDPVRYFLLREMSFGADGTYSHDALIERLNGDLANGLGNLVARVLRLIETEAAGRIPAAGAETEPVKALGEAARKAYAAFTAAFERYAFSEGLAAIFEFIGDVNRFLVREEPWKLAKDPARAAGLPCVLRASAEALRSAALWLAPVMPGASRETLRQLGLPPEPAAGALASWRWNEIPGGAAVVRGAALFPRIDRETTKARIEALAEKENTLADTGDAAPRAKPSGQPSAGPPDAAREPGATVAGGRAAPPAPAAAAGGPVAASGGAPTSPPGAARDPSGSTPGGSTAPPAAGVADSTAAVSGSSQPPGGSTAPPAELIDIDQFLTIQLRTARVESAERIPKADKLLRLIVDLGGEKRQIVAGIAATYAPEQLVGKTIVVVANLKPAKLRGVESQGMLLAADAGGGPIVVSFEREVPPGTRVR